jgi:lysozyme
LIDERKGGGISLEESDYLLANDLAVCEHDLVMTLPWWGSLDPVRQAALVELRFSLGLAGLLQFRWTLGHLRAGEYESAAGSLLASRWAQQVGAHRSARIATMLREGR